MMKLGDICSFQSGGTPSRSNSKYFNGTIPWITTVALTGGVIDENSAVEFISDDAIRQSAAKIVKPYSIMVGTRVGVGKVAINSVAMSTSQDVVSLIDIDETKWNKMFLVKFIQAKNNFLNSQARGATIKGIKIEVLAELELPDINLPTQRRIADMLDKVSEGITLGKKMMDELDLMVKAKFVEMFGDLSSPECQWKKCHLIEVCANKDDIKCGPFGTQLNKEEYLPEGVAVWEIPQINSQFAKKPTHFLTEQKAEQLSAYSLLPGDIAMSRKGNVGKCAIFPSCFAPGIIHSDVLRIRVDSAKVNPIFMMSQLHYSGAVTRQIEIVSSGAIMAGINVTKLKQIIVHVPPYAIQNRFAAFVTEIDKSKLTIQKILDKMEMEKLALMQEYFG